MPALIHCDEISKAFGSLTVLDGLTFGVDANDRVGVIGPNGAGKSTLLKILAGSEDIDDGKLFRTKGTRVNYVPQFEEFNDNLRVIDWLGAQLSDEVDLDAARPNMVLRRLGFDETDICIGELSGGWKKRLLLAGGLLNESDLVLFDEPTNHLDLEGIVCIERILRNANFAWVMVTHDRRLLDATVQRIVEVNRCYPGSTLENEGGYRKFCERRADYFSMQQSRRDSVANKLRREEEWLSRSPKARAGKSRYRSEQVDELRREYRQAASACSEAEINLELCASGRQTKRLVELDGVSFGYEQDDVIVQATLAIHKRQRIGLLGRNGTGKTTLLKLLNSELEPRQGQLKQAPDLETVYFSQQREELVLERTVRRTLAESGDTIVVQGRGVHVASWAARFGFDGSGLDVPVSTLSGGERARLLIARLVIRSADVLLLDEPTNDLDLQTIEALEQCLKEYAGSVVIVSHDRSLLENVCDFYFGIDHNGAVERYGTFQQWEQQVLLGQKDKKESLQPKLDTPKITKKRRTYKEQKEFETIEEQVALAEAKEAALAADLALSEIQRDAEKLTTVFQQREDAQREVDALYARWAELEDKG